MHVSNQRSLFSDANNAWVKSIFIFYTINMLCFIEHLFFENVLYEKHYLRFVTKLIVPSERVIPDCNIPESEF